MAQLELAEVRSRVNIVDLIGRYVTLKPSGKGYKGRCPFHPDNTPSLMVAPDKGLWHCFGCGAGGDAIGFLMRIERLSFPEALGKLSQELGIALTGLEKKRSLFRACADAAEYFARELRSPSGRRAQDYLRARGIGDELWDRYGLGYAPPIWDGLLRALSFLGVDTLRELGLVVAGERGYYDLFRDRIMFQIRDGEGRPVGFAGRSFEGEPKYLNVPNTPLFTKGTLLYGLDLAKEAIQRVGRAVIVEGYTDVISFQTAGIEETVGSMGTALTEPQARLLSRYTDRVVIAYDRDAAGESSTWRGIAILLSAGLKVEVVQLPPGEDPDSLVRKYGPKAAHAILEKREPFHQFFVDELAHRYDLTTLPGKEQALGEVKAIWPEIKSLPLRQELVRGLSDLLSVPEEEVWVFLRTRKSSNKVHPCPALDEQEMISPEELVLHFLILGKLQAEVLGELAIQDFRPEYQPIVEKWLELWRKGGPPKVSELACELPPDSASHVARLSLLDLAFRDEGKACEDALIRFLYLPRLERDLKEVQSKIQEAEARSDGVAVRRLTAQYQELCRERLRLLRRRS